MNVVKYSQTNLFLRKIDSKTDVLTIQRDKLQKFLLLRQTMVSDLKLKCNLNLFKYVIDRNKTNTNNTNRIENHKSLLSFGLKNSKRVA